MPRLRDRRLQPELMDQPGLDPKEHAAALNGLKRINAISGGGGAIWRELRQLARERRSLGSGEPFRALDLATGGGDAPIRLAGRAKRSGLDIEISGCDVSPVAVGHSRTAAEAAGAPITFFQRDVIADGPPEGYDVLMCSLFLHHLDESAAVELLGSMRERARVAVLVDDLERSWAGWWAAWIGVRALSRSPIVHVDGPRSVEGAFTGAEALDLARSAGWTRPSLERHWPFRFLLSERRP